MHKKNGFSDTRFREVTIRKRFKEAGGEENARYQLGDTEKGRGYEGWSRKKKRSMGRGVKLEGHWKRGWKKSGRISGTRKRMGGCSSEVQGKMIFYMVLEAIWRERMGCGVEYEMNKRKE